MAAELHRLVRRIQNARDLIRGQLAGDGRPGVRRLSRSTITLAAAHLDDALAETIALLRTSEARKPSQLTPTERAELLGPFNPDRALDARKA